MVEGGGNLDYAIKLDPFLPLPEEFAPLVKAIALRAHRFHRGVRLREDTRRGLQAAASIILANLLKAREIDPALYISLSLNSATYTKSRYTNHSLSYRSIRRVIEFLSRDGGDSEIEFYRGVRFERFKRLSRIRATKYFSVLIKQFKDKIPYLITNNSLSLPVSLLESQLDFEIIRLKDENKELIDYEDTEETDEMRSRVAEWNQFAKGQWPDIFVADAEFVTLLRDPPDEDQEEAGEIVGEDYGAVLDLTKRFLYRVFNNGSFEQGGRLYGAWWQWLPSEYRQYITINGAPTTEIDYSNMQIAMLYAREGLALPDDAYTLPGIDRQFRKLIKKTFLTLLNAREGQAIRAPRRDQLPPGMSFADLQTAIKEKHRPIERYIHSGVGIELQTIDAEIALDVILDFARMGHLVLPVHDSFIIAWEFSPVLQLGMEASYQKRLKSEIGTDIELSFVENFRVAPAEEIIPLWRTGARFQDSPIEGKNPLIVKLEAMYDQPEYDGYRDRIRHFFAKQPPEWQEPNLINPLAPHGLETGLKMGASAAQRDGHRASADTEIEQEGLIEVDGVDFGHEGEVG